VSILCQGIVFNQEARRFIMGTATEDVRADAKPAVIRRRFRLSDAMILIAATGMGFGVLAWLSRSTDGELSWWNLWSEVSIVFQNSGRGSLAEGILYLCAEVASLMSPLVAMWTLALLPIRLIAPRPRLRRIACQPGWIAVCAACSALAAIGLQMIGVVLVGGTDIASAPTIVADIFMYSPMFLGMAVAASWMTLCVGRRWRADRSWVDRSGRAVGCFWIVAAIALMGVVSLQATVQAMGIPFTVRVPANSALPAQAADEADEPESRPR
jgi:hypothetical protein